MILDRLITPISIVLVVLMHFGIFKLGDTYQKPSLEIGISSMEVVNLGDLDLGLAQEITAPEPVKEEPPKPKPKPKPEPKPKPVKEKLVAKKTSKPADIVTKTEEEIKPTEDNTSVADTANEDNKVVQERKAGGDQVGSGSAVSQATHMGGHLRNPKPPYPPISQENGEEGVVRLVVMVEADGRPSDVQLAKSSGYRRLDNSALKTVREKYRFTPATRGGFPIRTSYTFNIVFKLNK